MGNLEKDNEPMHQVLLWSNLGSQIKHDFLGIKCLSLVLIKSEQNKSDITGPVPKTATVTCYKLSSLKSA